MENEVKTVLPLLKPEEMFAPEEIKQRETDLTALWTDRRSKLSPEELKTEDDQIKADADKQAESANLNKVPEKYEIKLADGVEMDKETLAAAEPVFKKLGLTQAQAQELVDFYAKTAMPAWVKQSQDAWNKQVQDWYEETAKIKDIKINAAGENEEGLRVINTMLKPEEAKVLKDDLKKYGLHNHPMLNLMLARTAQHMKEDSHFMQGEDKHVKNPDKVTSTLNEIAEQMFPDKK